MKVLKIPIRSQLIINKYYYLHFASRNYLHELSTYHGWWSSPASLPQDFLPPFSGRLPYEELYAAVVRSHLMGLNPLAGGEEG